MRFVVAVVPADREDHELFPLAGRAAHVANFAADIPAPGGVLQGSDLFPARVVLAQRPVVVEGVIATVEVRAKVGDGSVGRLVNVEVPWFRSRWRPTDGLVRGERAKYRCVPGKAQRPVAARLRSVRWPVPDGMVTLDAGRPRTPDTMRNERPTDERERTRAELEDDDVPEWLERSWIERLRWHFDVFNEQYVARKLRPPMFVIRRSAARLGEWNPNRRTISISLSAHTLAPVGDRARHATPRDGAPIRRRSARSAPRAPHGEPFQRACRLLRCDPSPAADRAELGRLDGSDAVADKMLRRVKEILALASSSNEHEAANAMRMAHKYLLRYNLDLAEIEGNGERNYHTRHLGTCSGRIQEYQYALSSILQDHFFVLPIWVYSYDARRDVRGRILEVSGSRENLDMAEYVHDYLSSLGLRLWSEKQAERRRAARRGVKVPGGTKLQYLAGLLRGFQEKLRGESQHLEEEHGLVWLGDPELEKYFRHQHPRTRTVSTSGVSRSSSYDDGLKDGREITIRRGIPEGKAKSRGRLLGGPES